MYFYLPPQKCWCCCHWRAGMYKLNLENLTLMKLFSLAQITLRLVDGGHQIHHRQIGLKMNLTNQILKLQIKNIKAYMSTKLSDCIVGWFRIILDTEWITHNEVKQGVARSVKAKVAEVSLAGTWLPAWLKKQHTQYTGPWNRQLKGGINHYYRC